MLVTLLGLWLMLMLAGDTPLGRTMRRGLVEWPAARLAGIRRGAVISWMILFAIGALVDALVVAVMAASTLRFSAARTWIAARLAMRRRAPRQRRNRPAARSASNDDEDGWARFALAA